MRPLSLLSLSLCLLLHGTVQARTIRVPTDKPTIAAGIAAAIRGDVVEIACGTYYEHDLAMKSGITLRGATGSADCAIVDGQNLGRGLLVVGCDASTIVEGLTFRSCTANLDNQRGGGIWVHGSPATIRACALRSCTGGWGAGMAVESSGASPQIIECRFEGNVGGSIYVMNNGDPYIYKSVFAGLGQSIVVQLANARVARSTFVASGLSRLAGGHATVERCAFYQATIAADTVRCCFVGNPLFCTPSGPNYFVQTNSPCLVASGSCAGIIGAYGAGCGPGAPYPVTVTTNPPGAPVTIDGVLTATPAIMTWYPFSEHRVSMDSTTANGPQARWRFLSWSDGGARTHDVFVTSGLTSVVAQVRKQYKVRTFVATTEEPGVGGSINPMDPWADEGIPFQLWANPNPGSAFTGWLGSGPGSYSGPANPAVLTLFGPTTQRAHFRSIAYEFSVSASDTDPFVNSSAPSGGVRALSLWATCAIGGLTAFEGEVVGSLPMLGFIPAPGVLNAGNGNHLLLAVGGCPTGASTSVLLGTLYVTDEGGDLCIAATPTSPVAAVDCVLPVPGAAEDPGVTGFASLGTPCRHGTRTCTAAPPPPVAQATSVVVGAETPAVFSLLAARPNPFRADCALAFTLPRAERATLAVFEVTGRRVATLFDSVAERGHHDVSWDGRDAHGSAVGAGVYFVRLEAGGESRTMKVVRIAESR